MQNCAFCEIINRSTRDADVFYEDDKIIAILDKVWEVKGHSLVIWKQHKINASDLSEEDFLYFSKVYRRVEGAVLAVLEKKRVMTTKTGFLVNHFHFHIFPLESTITQQGALDILAKKVQYKASASEKWELIESLKSRLN